MQITLLQDIVKLQIRGLITIPKRFRQKLGLRENDFLKIKATKGRLIIEPLKNLPYKVRTYTKKDIEEFIKFDQEETKKIKKTK